MQANNSLIFLVDDDLFHLEIMKQLLTAAGYTKLQAFISGVDCLEHLHEQPAVVFLDQQMDVYTGYETLRKIKRYNPNIFVVMVSAQEDLDTAVASLKHGAFDYIRKDQLLENNIKGVLQKIEEVKILLQARKPSFIKSLFKFL